MQINLTKLPEIDKLLKEDSKNVLVYCDFNVLNNLKEHDLPFPLDITFYYDSFLVRLSLKLMKLSDVDKNVSTDFLENLLCRLSDYKKKVFFFGGSILTLSLLDENIVKKFSNIKIVGCYNGYNYETEKIIELINNSDCEVLFVGLGASRQEKWILNNYKKINCPLIVSVGGWFKLLSGEIKRAPKLIRRLNLEWLYKLITEFSRLWSRYLIGAPKFLYRVFISKEIELKLK